MSAVHTPGPWQVSGVRVKSLPLGRDTQLHMVGPNGDEVAAVFFDTKTGRGFADARLIAAAPDLLQALRDVMKYVDYARNAVKPGFFEIGFNRAEEAITKATGAPR